MMSQSLFTLRQVCMHRNATNSSLPFFGVYAAVTR